MPGGAGANCCVLVVWKREGLGSRAALAVGQPLTDPSESGEGKWILFFFSSFFLSIFITSGFCPSCCHVAAHVQHPLSSRQQSPGSISLSGARATSQASVTEVAGAFAMCFSSMSQVSGTSLVVRAAQLLTPGSGDTFLPAVPCFQVSLVCHPLSPARLLFVFSVLHSFHLWSACSVPPATSWPRTQCEPVPAADGSCHTR